MFKFKFIILCFCLCAQACSAESDKKVVVFAAASLTDAITAIAANYEKETNIEIQTSFASSSTLAKQIENGAPADIFISADTKWMQYLKDKKALNDATTVDLLGNQLVLIAPLGKVLNLMPKKVLIMRRRLQENCVRAKPNQYPLAYTQNKH